MSFIYHKTSLSIEKVYLENSDNENLSKGTVSTKQSYIFIIGFLKICTNIEDYVQHNTFLRFDLNIVFLKVLYHYVCEIKWILVD